MARGDAWKVLRLRRDAPRLFVRTSFNDAGYCIKSTDLSRLWGETLDKKAIIERASESGCSIDPSEDDQFQILLEKIGSALGSKKGTTLNLRLDHDQHGLELDVTATLPGALPTFKWTMHLQRLPDNTVDSDLVTPLLLYANNLQHHIQQLIDEISAKDRVISSLTDRMESSGTDLTTVFPGASNIKTNKRRSQREQLASHVRGLTSFNEGAWRASLTQSDETQELTAIVLDQVLGEVNVNCSGATPDVSLAWENLSLTRYGTQSTANISNQKLPERNMQRGPPSIPAEDNVANDEFQEQATPPHLKKRSLTPATEDGETDGGTQNSEHEGGSRADADDESTEDEGDLDAPLRRTCSQLKGSSQEGDETSNSSRPFEAAPRKLGLVGGKEAAPPEALPSASARLQAKLGSFEVRAKATPDSLNGEASGVSSSSSKPKSGMFSGNTDIVPSSVELESEPAELLPKSKGKLGTFGGKGRIPLPAALEVTQETGIKLSPEKHRLDGRGENRPESSATAEADKRQSLVAEKIDVNQERGDSEERPDRKRERLKRELEEKSKVPAKKKRKF